mmetsp:Transcript_5051/g.7037  ORF Transcript_5051/g.7037 Transcript_5051/m.7037 type:complete len:117 (-) Transcript_5051:199-549(-)
MSAIGFIGSLNVGVGSKAGSSFVCSNQRPVRSVSVARNEPRWSMAKVAKFGVFSPAVIATRVVVGEKRFNKLRGKGIALHSQVIGDFCKYIGAEPKVRTGLIGLAKNNGNTLGFLS